MNKKLSELAKKHFNIDTLETRNRDSLDFHDCAVWSIKQAFEEAYNLGKEASTKSTIRLMKKVIKNKKQVKRIK